MRQAQINVRTRACSRTSIARTKQAALTHNVRGKELIISSLELLNDNHLVVLCKVFQSENQMTIFCLKTKCDIKATNDSIIYRITCNASICCGSVTRKICCPAISPDNVMFGEDCN